MKKHIIRFVTLLALSASVISCEKDYDGLGPLEDSIAEIPVTVTNATFFERIPIVTASVAAAGSGTNKGPFSITFQIPADKGKIKEITRVTTGTNGLANLQNTGTAAQIGLGYNVVGGTQVAIQGNGSNEITFTSDLTTYTNYRTRVGAAVAGNAATVTMVGTPPTVDERNPNFLRFWFLITLEDGKTIIPTEVRVRILP